MKTSIFLALAIAALSAPSFAQSETLELFPDANGKLPSLESLPLKWQLKFDPKLPALPKLSATDPAKIKLRTLETYRGPIFQMEIVRKNQADVLSSIIAAMGGHCVIEPSISKTYYQTAVFRALSLEELLKDVCGSSIETWKSSAGVYFFANKPLPVLDLPELIPIPEKTIKPEESPKTIPDFDPFIFPPKDPNNPRPKFQPNRPEERRGLDPHIFPKGMIPQTPPATERKGQPNPPIFEWKVSPSFKIEKDKPAG